MIDVYEGYTNYVCNSDNIKVPDDTLFYFIERYKENFRYKNHDLNININICEIDRYTSSEVYHMDQEENEDTIVDYDNDDHTFAELIAKASKYYLVDIYYDK